MLLCLSGAVARGQTSADGPVLRARHAAKTASFKMWQPAGRLRLVAWNRDSIVVRGRVAAGSTFGFGGDSLAMKFVVEEPSSRGTAGRGDLVVYVPAQSRVSVKTVGADIEGSGVSGFFYTVSGAIRLSGTASSVEAESMTGSMDLDVTTPWLRARTGDGHLLLRGKPDDVDAATIAGTLDIATTTPLRAQFSSVSGDIHYAGTPAAGAIFEFSNHSGAVDLALPRTASGAFALSSITGAIENGFSGVRPVASPPRSLRVTLGRGSASVTVRTFKGAIRLRPASP